FVGSRFVLLGGHPVLLGVWVMPHARHLPGDFASRRATCNLEVVILQLFSDVKVWSRRTYRSQLVAEVVGERLKVGWHLDNRFALIVQSGVAVVDVHHIGAFDGRLAEGFVGRVERI